MRLRVLCEINPDTKQVIRIFKYPATAIFLKPECVLELPRQYAVENVRRQVYDVSGGECRNCGALVSWSNFHMHEQTPKSKGGEVSIHNSVALCADCHLNQEHKSRKPQFKRRTNVLE